MADVPHPANLQAARICSSENWRNRLSTLRRRLTVMLSGAKTFVHPLDGEVKSLYSPHPCRTECGKNRFQTQPNIEEFVVLRQGLVANRSLSLKGQCAFVRAAFGFGLAVVTMNERHLAKSQRPVGSLGYEDWMHPGKGGA